ncbi:thiol-disulfide isomerase/thioredoxin [Dysgonomonadaceae bacterium PH5-43]|nr:thiol-disulfide isomerase/thioredoxin [Dysgonomonadaceae bacterium PH5-43]
MKNLFLSIFLLSNSLFLFSQEEFEYRIEGTFPETVTSTYVYLIQTWPELEQNTLILSDSALIENGKFIMQGTSRNNGYVYTLSPEDSSYGGLVVLEPGTIHFTYKDYKTAGISYARGTRLNDWVTDSLNVPSVELMEFAMNNLSDITTKSPEEQQQIFEQQRPIAKRYIDNLISFIEKNAKLPIGEYYFIILQQVLRKEDKERILPLMSDEAQMKCLEINSKIQANYVKEGETYRPFTAKKIDESSFVLSEVIGEHELTLLNFWASWCRPCLKKIPYLKELQEKYGEKGLNIVGVSIDENEMFWRKAVEKNEMNWIQVIDNAEASQRASILYGVDRIPANVLVDKDGQIVGVNLSEEELSAKVESILKMD